jgi:hypothetical protein
MSLQQAKHGADVIYSVLMERLEGSAAMIAFASAWTA